MHLGIEDLRRIEAKTKAELDESINRLEMETKSSPFELIVFVCRLSGADISIC